MLCCTGGTLMLFSTFFSGCKGAKQEELVSYLQKQPVSCWIKANVCAWHQASHGCVRVYAELASSVLQHASEKQPCINRTPTDTIFSGGDAFQHMCWWMTTGWRCDFEAPNVLSLTTCACQCDSSLTLGWVGAWAPPLPFLIIRY